MVGSGDIGTDAGTSRPGIRVRPLGCVRARRLAEWRGEDCVTKVGQPGHRWRGVFGRAPAVRKGKDVRALRTLRGLNGQRAETKGGA